MASLPPYVGPFYVPEPETLRPLRLEARTTIDHDLSKGFVLRTVRYLIPLTSDIVDSFCIRVIVSAFLRNRARSIPVASQPAVPEARKVQSAFVNFDRKPLPFGAI